MRAKHYDRNRRKSFEKSEAPWVEEGACDGGSSGSIPQSYGSPVDRKLRHISARFDRPGGITGELCGVDFVSDLSDVGGIRVKLVPHGEGADNLTVSAQDAAALSETDAVRHRAPSLLEGFNAFSSSSVSDTPSGVDCRSAPRTLRHPPSFSSSSAYIRIPESSSRPRSRGWGIFS